jgi:hypothetical protein
MKKTSNEKGDRDSWGLSSKHLSLLGAIAAGSAALEQNLAITLRSQLGLDAPINNILVSGMPLQILLKKVITIARYQLEGTQVLLDLEQWNPRVRAAAENRNAALHSAWITNPSPGTLMSSSMAKTAVQGAFTSRTWTISELEELIEEINELNGELFHYWPRMGHIAGVPAEKSNSE